MRSISHVQGSVATLSDLRAHGIGRASSSSEENSAGTVRTVPVAGTGVTRGAPRQVRSQSGRGRLCSGDPHRSRVPFASWTLRRLEVLGVGHVLTPGRLALAHGEMRHQPVRSRTVPVPLATRRDDAFAWSEGEYRAASGLDPGLAFGDVEGLADRVRVPGRAGTG